MTVLLSLKHSSCFFGRKRPGTFLLGEWRQRRNGSVDVAFRCHCRCCARHVCERDLKPVRAGLGRICSPFVLETFGAFAGPAPDTEPNVEGKTDDPEGVPRAQRLPARIPLVFRRDGRAPAVRRDGQEGDDRDNLFTEPNKYNTLRPCPTVGQPSICLTWEASTTSEMISDTSSFRALLFRPYPKKTSMRPAMDSLC